jgi:hypothetical protein
MDSNQDESVNDTENLTGEVLDSLGVPQEGIDDVENAEAESATGTAHQQGDGNQGVPDPLYVQKRLKQQKRAHEREIRELHARMNEMQSGLQSNQSTAMSGSPNPSPGGGINDAIHQAVSFALNHRDMEERKAKEAQGQAHIAKQYQGLQKHLDETSDKYDDFEDVVRGEGAQFTPHMRDAALMLPKKGPGSAGEVLYKLGKNPEELSRIAKLHPVDQASELVALSHAMISGGENKQSSPRNLGQVKANPVVNSAGVTEKTSPGAIRALMKAGKFK